LVRLRNARRNRLLTYHRFNASNALAFDKQCEHLRTHYTPVTLDDIADFQRYRKPLPPSPVAVTVDDGYRDFYLYAYPSLKRYRIPATVFLITDFIDGITWPWWNQIRYAFEHTPMEAVDLTVNGRVFSRRLSSVAFREQVYDEIQEALKSVPDAGRREFMARLPEWLQVDVPAAPPPGLEPLTWDEIREMESNGIAFGAHTKSHPMLAMVEADEQVREEIAGSRDRVAAQLGRPPAHFAYPNGRPQDITERVRRIVEQAGFRTALTTERGLNGPGTDPYLLRRISMEPEVPGMYYCQQLAGFRVGNP
jgi:peptidoglycan/xylan/chitin deacetylase (PgdA/CDA1 family)